MNNTKGEKKFKKPHQNKQKDPTNKKPPKTHPKKKPTKETQDQTPDDDLFLKTII